MTSSGTRQSRNADMQNISKLNGGSFTNIPGHIRPLLNYYCIVCSCFCNSRIQRQIMAVPNFGAAMSLALPVLRDIASEAHHSPPAWPCCPGHDPEMLS